MDEVNDQVRESFVGTPLYVAPEMLSDCKALPATDLWSLGCMIFRMHTGRYPFSAPIESLLFQKILLRDFEWPEDIDIPFEAKDIVERILEINPNERLGAG